MILRSYQQECISIIESKPPGSYLCQMPTGCGKTATFTHIPRHGRVPVGEYPAECGCDGAKPMIRPPQSWCYVEELDHTDRGNNGFGSTGR